MNNMERATWAKKALSAHTTVRNTGQRDAATCGRKAVLMFARLTGVHTEDWETQLSDFHCDLRHYADEKQVIWQEVERRAAVHTGCSDTCSCKLPASLVGNLVFLVCDLRRFAKANSVVWCNVLARSLGHYEAETSCTCPYCKAQGDPEFDYEFDDEQEGDFAICYRCGETFEVSPVEL